MLKFSVKVDLSKMLRKFQVVESQVKFATALALTKTAQATQQELTAGLTRTFKSVTPFTKRAFFINKATKQNLTAVVGIKDKQAQYLYREMVGGARDPALEKLLTGALPSGFFVVPTDYSKLTSQGKVSLAWVRKIVQAIQSAGGPLVKRRRQSKAAVPFIVGSDSKLHPGIWITQNNKTTALLLFVRQPKYAAKFRFYADAESAARRAFPAAFREAVSQALASAR